MRLSTDALTALIKNDPSNVPAYYALAEQYESEGKFSSAELALRRAIELGPLNADSWRRLGTYYVNRGAWDAAADAFEQSCGLDGSSVDGWVGYGMALLGSQNIKRASDVSELLSSKYCDIAVSHLIVGHVAKVQGNFSQAAAAYEQALEIDPAQSEALFNLADIEAGAPGRVMDAIQSLWTSGTLSLRDSANLGFALARIYERSGNVEQAFECLRKATGAMETLMSRIGNQYDPDGAEREVEELTTLFSARAMAHQLPPLDLDVTPIFIVGLPRSGTSLVERIIANHSFVRAGGELPYMQEALALLRDSVRAPAGDRIFSGDRDVSRQLLLHLREVYMDGLFERELDARYVTDKLPANFAALGLIRLLFPNSPIVHVVRDPVATCWSLYATHFGAHLAYNTSFDNLIHYHNKVYVRLMRHWNVLFPASIFEVSYESLVAAPRRTIVELLEGCGIPMEAACLSESNPRRPIYTASMQHVRTPINSGSVDRWRKFQTYLAPLIENLSSRGTSAELSD